MYRGVTVACRGEHIGGQNGIANTTKNHHIDMPRAAKTATNHAKFRRKLSACVLMDCEVILHRGVTVACRGERVGGQNGIANTYQKSPHRHAARSQESPKHSNTSQRAYLMCADGVWSGFVPWGHRRLPWVPWTRRWPSLRYQKNKQLNFDSTQTCLVAVCLGVHVRS